MTDLRVHVAAVGSGADGGANLDRALAAVDDAARDGARLLVLPEYMSRYDPRGVGREHSEPLDGPFVTQLTEACRSTGIMAVAGTLLPAEDGARAVNAVVVLGADGMLGLYRKVHLYDAFGYRESDRLDPGPAGAAPVVVDLDGHRVGVMTCYDLRFPESARRLVDAGATVVVVPAAWVVGEHKADHWSTLLRARAIENTCYVLGAAQQGRGVTGDSLVIDPLGVVLARSSGPGPAVAEVSTTVLDRVRARNPSLANRRYGVVPLAGSAEGATGEAPGGPTGDGAGFRGVDMG